MCLMCRGGCTERGRRSGPKQHVTKIQRGKGAAFRSLDELLLPLTRRLERPMRLSDSGARLYLQCAGHQNAREGGAHAA